MRYVLVHGACHDGRHFEATAAALRSMGHEVHCPTIQGNREGDDRRTTRLEDAIASLVAFFEEKTIEDAVLVGHSWGGMVITGAFDRLGSARIRRLVYYGAFVPNDGESLIDLCPPHYRDLFRHLAEPANEVVFPYPIFREAFVNDGSLEQAEALFGTLNPQPFLTMADPIRLSRDPAAFDCGKSFLHCTEETALPQSYPFHPRLSERLGLFRLVSMPGSHSTFHTAPELLAEKLVEAGRD